MGYFKNVKSFEDLKAQFRALAISNHPDVGGSLEVMKEINVEYSYLFPIWKDRHEKATGEKTDETAESSRRHFYTQNGWEGSNYDPKLSLKEIAEIARGYVKRKVSYVSLFNSDSLCIHVPGAYDQPDTGAV